jgi:hypothetical protein
MLFIPESALPFGFVNGPGGTHTSRTMMLEELRLLFAACSLTATYEDYCQAIIEDNVLLKKTVTTRHRSLRGLRELYGLDSKLLVFRVLRELWETDTAAQPLLALLCAVARDPLLRASSTVIQQVAPEADVASTMLAEAVQRAFPDRYNPATLAKIGRNTASSWTQSGHLSGRTAKVRATPETSSTAVAYALLLGFLCNERGERLFDTLWVRLLDKPVDLLHRQAFAAAQRGWLEYRCAGDVVDITFQHFLSSP